MAIFLLRRWFVLVLAAGGALAVWRPLWFGWAGHVDPRLVVAGALFLMAWALPARRLARAIGRPWPALWAVGVSYAILPAAGWAAGLVLPTDLRVGLLLITCVPCTLASAVLWTRRAGGDEAVALVTTFATTASSWLVTPAWLILGTGAAVGVDRTAMMADLALTLLLPVGVGQLCQAWAPLARAAIRFKAPLGVVSQLLILLILLRAAASVGERLQQGTAAASGVALAGTVVACVGVHLAALGCGLWGGKGFGFDAPARVAVAFAGSQKTLPVALLLFERYFQADYPLAVLSITFYHFGQLIVDTFIADALALPADCLERGRQEPHP